MGYLRKALNNCKYPKRANDRVERRVTQPSSGGNNKANNQDPDGVGPTTETKTIGHIVLPYTQGLCKTIKKICGKYGIHTHFKGNKTIKNVLESPKGKDAMEKKSQAICCFQCGELVCDKEYIGETSRTFG